MKNKLKLLINKPELILILLFEKVAFMLSDKIYLKIIYYLKFHKKLDLRHPRTFNEKIQWLKLNDRDLKYKIMVDKFESKKFVANIIGDKYIIPTLGIYDKFEDIDFEKLPNQFVLKTTHDSGGVLICDNKKTFNCLKAKKIINKHLKKNPFLRTREWPYKEVKPRIISEKYLVDESGKELKDYKFFCFNGKVRYIQVDFERFSNHKRNIYDTNWQFQNFKIEYPNDPNTTINKPNQFVKMIEIAETLSKNIAHLRVDLYSINDKIFFGELTFHHGSGTECFYPKEWDYKFGDLIKL